MLKQAVFLVGGKGTRLGSKTANMPKPCLEIGGRPFIAYLIETAARHGMKDIILLAGHSAEVVEEQWGHDAPAAQKLAERGVTISIVVEPEPAGTGGALQQIADRLDETFLFANGDSFFDFNWLDLLTIPADEDWVGKIALRQIADAERYGRVDLSGTRIAEFSGAGRPGPGVINGGVYLLRRTVLDLIDRSPLSFEQDVLPDLAVNGKLFGRSYDCFFIDIGIPVDFDRADQVMLDVWSRPAVFLDRDGVLNVDHGYVHRPDQIDWIEGAQEAVKHLNDNGYLVFVVSNQAGVARGYYPEQAVLDLHQWMAEQLQAAGAHIDEFEYCPDHPDGVVERYRRLSHRRKPGPGMLEEVFSRWPVRKADSLLVGDQESDIKAAESAGIPGHLFAGGNLVEFLGSLLHQKK